MDVSALVHKLNLYCFKGVVDVSALVDVCILNLSGGCSEVIDVSRLANVRTSNLSGCG